MSAVFPCFLINLDTSVDRLAYVSQQAEAAKLTFERFNAVRGKGMARSVNGDVFAEHLTDGEVGCYMSHLSCMRLMLERGWPYALILEDDISIEAGIVPLLCEAVASAPLGWDYIHLSSVVKNRTYPVVTLPSGGRTLVAYSRLPVNTAGYIISAAGAEKFLRPDKRLCPIDMEIRYGWRRNFNIYGMLPAPVRQRPEFDSDIGHRSRKQSLSRLRHRWEPSVWSRLYGVIWQTVKLSAARRIR
ncbi:MAG: glycosyltransferase family 25 protein [Asticcacaulis sp.]